MCNIAEKIERFLHYCVCMTVYNFQIMMQSQISYLTFKLAFLQTQKRLNKSIFQFNINRHDAT